MTRRVLFARSTVLIIMLMLSFACRRAEQTLVYKTHSTDPWAVEAYKIAEEMPADLAQVQCSCGCQKKHNHTSALMCFQSDHAETCGMCQSIAFNLKHWRAEGKLMPEIKMLMHNMEAFPVH